MDMKLWWDSMTAAQRKAVIRRDKSMRNPLYSMLVDRMAGASYDALTTLQRESLPDFHAMGGRK
jgi:hypothetical protein